MSECRFWDGPRFADGLPKVELENAEQPAAVVLLEEKLGRLLEEGEMVAWSCANRQCVSPEHLHPTRWKKVPRPPKTAEEKEAARKKSRAKKRGLPL